MASEIMCDIIQRLVGQSAVDFGTGSGEIWIKLLGRDTSVNQVPSPANSTESDVDASVFAGDVGMV